MSDDLTHVWIVRKVDAHQPPTISGDRVWDYDPTRRITELETALREIAVGGAIGHYTTEAARIARNALEATDEQPR